MIPGEIVPGPGTVLLNAGRRTATLRVRNTSRWPVQVSSHYPFALANRRLVFNRAAAQGMRLDVPAGGSVRWRPGEEREVRLVAIGD